MIIEGHFCQFSIMEKYAKLPLITKYPPYLFFFSQGFTILMKHLDIQNLHKKANGSANKIMITNFIQK